MTHDKFCDLDGMCHDGENDIPHGGNDYCDVCRNWCSCGWIARIREDERSNA